MMIQNTTPLYVLPLAVFQAEERAIYGCVNSLQAEHDASILICSDSQTALTAPNSVKTTCSSAVETMVTLKQLSAYLPVSD